MSKTEERNPLSLHLDRMSPEEMIRLMNRENEIAVHAVGKAEKEIAEAIEAAARSIQNGHRLIYIGAGTSGRLGVLDAAECPPTFGVRPDEVVGIIAGGKDAMFRASEGAEDNEEAGNADLREIALCSGDTVIGISANGNAAYVAGALLYAKKIGATAVSLTCNYPCRLTEIADISIVTDTGPEVLTGSTRLKAGTAQKLVLNMISTGAMVKTGKVYENLMINLRPSNKKLRHRMVTIVMEILHCPEEEAVSRLESSGWVIRTAVGQD